MLFSNGLGGMYENGNFQFYNPASPLSTGTPTAVPVGSQGNLLDPQDRCNPAISIAIDNA